eukprot:758420-Rhodomonas_salina.1
MPGTEPAYGAMRCLVLIKCTVLRVAWYQSSAWCYQRRERGAVQTAERPRGGGRGGRGRG